MHYRIIHNNKNYIFRIEDRVWFNLDGTQVFCVDLKQKLTEVCSDRYNKPLEYFQPIRKKFGQVTIKEKKKREKRIKTTKNKKWKIKFNF